VRVNDQLILQFAIAQNFYLLPGTHKAMRAKQIRRDGFTRGESVQVPQVITANSFPKGLRKPRFGMRRCSGI